MLAISVIAIVSMLVTSSFAADATTNVTTYTALAQKNTSAGFALSTEALAGTPSENVSKTSIASVLPAGLNPRIYAHFLAWFGTTGHADVGYSSADAIQVQKQVGDMLSRGINGVIVNWHGRADFTDQAASLIMAESDTHAGSFEFSIEEDAHALAECAATPGCDLDAKIEADLKYVQTTYTSAVTYMKFAGRPVIFLYGMEAYKLNWDKIRNSLSGNPVLMFRPAPATTSLLNAPQLSLSPQWQMACFNDLSTDQLSNHFDGGMQHA